MVLNLFSVEEFRQFLFVFDSRFIDVERPSHYQNSRAGLLSDQAFDEEGTNLAWHAAMYSLKNGRPFAVKDLRKVAQRTGYPLGRILHIDDKPETFYRNHVSIALKQAFGCRVALSSLYISFLSAELSDAIVQCGCVLLYALLIEHGLTEEWYSRESISRRNI